MSNSCVDWVHSSVFSLLIRSWHWCFSSSGWHGLCQTLCVQHDLKLISRCFTKCRQSWLESLKQKKGLKLNQQAPHVPHLSCGRSQHRFENCKQMMNWNPTKLANDNTNNKRTTQSLFCFKPNCQPHGKHQSNKKGKNDHEKNWSITKRSSMTPLSETDCWLNVKEFGIAVPHVCAWQNKQHMQLQQC